MNREIKFRAWNEEEKYMEELAWPFFVMDSETIIDVRGLGGFSKELKRKVLQYTGLKDKNGKEIWEGDILKDNNDWSDHEPTFRKQGDILICGWCNHYASFMFSNNSRGGVNDILLTANKELEVIGNIHENPELINQNNPHT